jgi:predicted outer membrane protein
MAHVNPIQIQKFLKGVDYPASKQALLAKAKSMGADENVCHSIEQLPDGDFQTPADVSQAFGRLPDEVTGAGHARQARATRQHGEHRGGKEEAGAPEAHAGRPAEEAPRQRSHRDAGHHDQPRYTGGNEFLIEAMQDAMAEIRICELAIEKSQNPDVKKFAQSMIDEHGRMGRELEQLAGDKALEVPREVRPEQEMTVDELSALSGRDFEQRWIQYNIDVHERDTKVFRHYAEDPSDHDIAAMARKHGATLGKHLKAAHELGKKLARP